VRRQLRAVGARLRLGELARALGRWAAFVDESERLRAVGIKFVARWTRAQLLCAFIGWQARPSAAPRPGRATRGGRWGDTGRVAQLRSKLRGGARRVLLRFNRMWLAMPFERWWEAAAEWAAERRRAARAAAVAENEGRHAVAIQARPARRARAAPGLSAAQHMGLSAAHGAQRPGPRRRSSGSGWPGSGWAR
jgi:hypothetical protein